MPTPIQIELDTATPSINLIQSMSLAQGPRHGLYLCREVGVISPPWSDNPLGDRDDAGVNNLAVPRQLTLAQILLHKLLETEVSETVLQGARPRHPRHGGPDHGFSPSYE